MFQNSLISMLFTDPIIFVLLAMALIVSLSIHEFAHAFVADKLGDPTPRYLGRVTLNPKSHLDPVGTIAILLFGFGWGRPVPFNPINLSNPKRDAALIAVAGPVSNFLMAILMATLFHFFGGMTLLGAFLYLTAMYNLGLGFFNLIPIHPLDGFKVVRGFLSNNLLLQWDQTQQWGMWILLLLVMTDSFGNIISPIIGTSMKILGLVY